MWKKIKKLLLFKELHEFQSQYFGVVGIIHSSVPYFLWEFSYAENLYMNLIHLMAGAICFTVLMKEDVPCLLRNNNWLWYLALLYSFPFQGCIMFLLNMSSYNWAIYFITSIMLLVFFTESMQFLILSICGVFLAILFSFLFIDFKDIVHYQNMSAMIYMYASCFFVSLLWSFSLEKKRIEKLELAMKIAGQVSHEVRTPLLYFSTLSKVFKEINAKLVECYKVLKQKKITLPKAYTDQEFEYIQKIPDNIESISRNTNIVIDMILVRLKGESYDREYKILKIADCINEAVTNLTDPNIKTHIKVKDFKVHAPYSLILHVFYNLFKNSFYFLKETDNPKINISSSNDGKYNIIHFRDNGLGIDSQNMKQLFQDFYSQRTGGVGLGLSFCKDVMRSLGGYIDCDSELNKYTQFNLFFPKVKKHVQ